MPQHWLKPLGVSNPPAPLPDDWTAGMNLEIYPLTSGPNKPRPPQMGRGDLVLFHAVGHGRIFAAGKLLKNPVRHVHPKWGERWPWLYECRVDVWVPLIQQGIRSGDWAPKKAINRIRAGGEFALLTPEEYRTILDALANQSAACSRPELLEEIPPSK